jgi:hypothetical protein
METGHEYEAPPSVAKVLQERIARLTVEALQVLQTSAILGDRATLDRVEKVLELSPHQLLSAVEELGRAAMLRSQSDGIGSAARQLQPLHDFLSSAATSQLTPVSLAFIHRRCAEVLEREIPQETKPTTLLWACAGHRRDAGDRERALALSLSCAEHLLGVGLARDSCIAFQKSLEYCVADEERLGVLPRLAFAFQMDAEWNRSKDVLRKCIELSARLDPSASTHNEFELQLLYARFQSSLEFSVLLQDLIPCVECVSASPAHRVRAAVMALKIATDTGPGELIDALYQRVAPILNQADVPERGRQELEIVYQTLRADAPIPLTDLTRFVEAATRTDGLDYLNTVLTVASACRISGRYGEGMAFVTQAIEHARSHKLTNRLAQAYLAAVRLHIAASEFAKADSALLEAQRCATSSDDPRAHAEPLLLEARIAIETGDWGRAEAAFGKIDAAIPEGSASRKAHFFALAIHFQLTQPFNPGSMQVLVNELQKAHAVIQGIGVQDFESYALFLGLNALGQESEAKSVLREYVYKHRRSRWPLPKKMRAALKLPNMDTLGREPARATFR